MTWKELVEKAKKLGFDCKKDSFYGDDDYVYKYFDEFEGCFIFYKNGNISYDDRCNEHLVTMMFKQKPVVQYVIMRDMCKTEKNLRKIKE